MRLVVLHPYTEVEVCRPCHSEDMAHDVSALMGLVTLTYDPETGMLVASKAGNVPSKFGHAKPLGSGIIHYVRAILRQMYGQKLRLLPPSLWAGE